MGSLFRDDYLERPPKTGILNLPIHDRLSQSCLEDLFAQTEEVDQRSATVAQKIS